MRWMGGSLSACVFANRIRNPLFDYSTAGSLSDLCFYCQKVRSEKSISVNLVFVLRSRCTGHNNDNNDDILNDSCNEMERSNYLFCMVLGLWSDCAHCSSLVLSSYLKRIHDPRLNFYVFYTVNGSEQSASRRTWRRNSMVSVESIILAHSASIYYICVDLFHILFFVIFPLLCSSSAFFIYLLCCSPAFVGNVSR